MVERVANAIKDGTLYAATHPLEISVGERLKRMTGLDKVRFANSGSEATMHALRIARAYTNREKFIKFEGTYHGMYDYVLFSTTIGQARSMGSRRSPIRIASSSGIPYGIGEYVYHAALQRSGDAAPHGEGPLGRHRRHHHRAHHGQ